MAHIIDARGLACPQPVILTKKALEQQEEVVVILDVATACENVRKLAASLGHSVSEERQNGDTKLTITRVGACGPAVDAIASAGPVVVAISSDTMGRGDDTLGTVLMKSFLHTLPDTTPKPDVMIFFNTGVRLTVAGSEVLDDLGALAGKGVKILVCGTCLNYFKLTDKLAAGQVSNMYDIAQSMLGAGRLVRI